MDALGGDIGVEHAATQLQARLNRGFFAVAFGAFAGAVLDVVVGIGPEMRVDLGFDDRAVGADRGRELLVDRGRDRSGQSSGFGGGPKILTKERETPAVASLPAMKRSAPLIPQDGSVAIAGAWGNSPERPASSPAEARFRCSRRRRTGLSSSGSPPHFMLVADHPYPARRSGSDRACPRDFHRAGTAAGGSVQLEYIVPGVTGNPG